MLTGGTGLLGHDVLERLAGVDEVVALHRPGTEPPAVTGVSWVAQDLTAPLGRALPERVDALVHLAQSRRHRDFPDGAVDTFEVNATATVRLLDYCRRAGGARFVHASSGAVYGPGDRPRRETDRPAPSGFYAESKLAAERACEAFGEHFDVKLLRLFFVYGPRQDAGAFMPGLVERVCEGRPIDLRGPDGMRCNPIYVEDAATAVAAALASPGSEVVNVAGPEVVTLRGIGERLGELLGREPRFAPAGPAADMVADVARMRERLAEPRVAVADGLARMLRR